jgi:hypothetical protein
MDRKRRIARPILERMEKRELLTVGPAMFAGADQLTQANSLINNFAATVAAGSTSTVTAADATNAVPTPNSSQGTVTASPTSPDLIPMSAYQGTTPTAAELANEKYTAVFTGTYTTAAPRFTDQSSQTYIQAVGSTTDELHGDIQLTIITPQPLTPGEMAPANNPNNDVEGLAVNLDKDSADGAFLALDVFGSPSTSLNSAGLPTNLQFSFSPYTGAGSFTGGLYSLAEGAGNITIHYKPSKGKLPAGVYSKGTVTVVVQGLIYTSGVTNPFANSNLEASHSVPSPVGKDLPKVVNKSSHTSPILKNN